ncbi:HEPN domain-containing protein [Aeromonas sp. 19NY04SH05-1]|uniref:HEPN domain-containing protein n=3 Tax=Aeromonadaceae TaxID=84642 RepID=A0AAU6T4S6_9GAMM
MDVIMFGLEADRSKFKSDPLSYSAQGFLQWRMIESMVTNSDFDPYVPPTNEILKNPILWISQAEALTQAAVTIIKSEPKFENMPIHFRGICDSQFCAIGLMLIGYSLEVTLKAMMVINHGIDGYKAIEKKNRHHRLHVLADVVPGLTDKDKAILQGITHFVYWAGRYPDPGSGREDDASEIFSIAEENEITAKDVFYVASKIMAYTINVVDEKHF